MKKAVLLIAVLFFMPNLASGASCHCVGGSNPGDSCTKNSQCYGTCSNNSKIKCNDSWDCAGVCVGGDYPGGACISGFCIFPSVCWGAGTCTDMGACIKDGISPIAPCS